MALKPMSVEDFNSMNNSSNLKPMSVEEFEDANADKESMAYAASHLGEAFGDLGKQSLLGLVGTRDKADWQHPLNYLSPWANKADVTENDIQNAKAIQKVGNTSLAIGASIAAPELIPEIAPELAIGKPATWLAKGIASSAAYQGAADGKISAAQTGEDLIAGAVLEGGLRGVTSLFRPIANRVVKAGNAYMKGAEQAGELSDAFKSGYAASQGDALLAMAKHEYAKNPNATVEELFQKWGEVHPQMADVGVHGNEVSQIERINDAIFNGEEVGHLTEEELKARIKGAQALSNAETFTTLALNGESGARSVIDAIDHAEGNRRFYELPTNPTKLDTATLEELGAGKAYRATSNALGYGEKALLSLPTWLRKGAVTRTKEQIIDAARVRLVNEVNYLNKKIVELGIERKGKSGVEAILHNRQIQAFSHQLKADQKLLKRFNTASKGRKVDTSNLYDMYKESQDNIFEGMEHLADDAEFAGLNAAMRDSFNELNALSDIAKSNDISLTSAVLSTVAAPAELYMLPATLGVTAIKSGLDRQFIRDIRTGKGMSEEYQQTINMQIDMLNNLKTVMEENGAPKDALDAVDSKIDEVMSDSFEDFVKKVLSDKQQPLNKKFNQASRAVGTVVTNQLNNKEGK